MLPATAQYRRLADIRLALLSLLAMLTHLVGYPSRRGMHVYRVKYLGKVLEC